MNEALSPFSCLRRAALARQRSQELARQIDGVHHTLGLRLHRMSGDAINDDLGPVARKGFPANFPSRTAVQRVGNIGSKHSQIQFVDAPADLLIGSEANSN